MYDKMTIYGLADRRRAYKPLAYWIMDRNDISSNHINYAMNRLLDKEPGIAEFYLIDNYRGLHREFLETLNKPGIESFRCFKNILETRGVQITLSDAAATKYENTLYGREN